MSITLAYPMIKLVLQVTIPVVIGIALAGWAAHRAGRLGVWLALCISLFCATLAWGVGWESSFAQRFVAPVAVYAPPLLLGGLALNLMGPRRWQPVPIFSLAAGLAVANIFLAQFTFVLGCTVQLWECP